MYMYYFFLRVASMGKSSRIAAILEEDMAPQTVMIQEGSVTDSWGIWERNRRTQESLGENRALFITMAEFVTERNDSGFNRYRPQALLLGLLRWLRVAEGRLSSESVAAAWNKGGIDLPSLAKTRNLDQRFLQR